MSISSFAKGRKERIFQKIELKNMKNKKIIPIFILLFSLVLVSGCIEQIFVENGTTYEKQPTKISYTISYGYSLKCSGMGDFNLMYDCDTPEVLNGQATIIEVLNPEYENITLASFNDMKSWNLSKNSCTDLELGITASVIAESFVVSDLNGDDALTIEEIQNHYPLYVSQYCNAQSNDTRIFIDPDSTIIKNKANQILNTAGTNNSFLAAKQIFIWLKENTEYSIHLPGDNNVQTCDVTLEKKTGDCDDLSFLYIALCRAVNIPARFVRGFLIEDLEAVAHAWAEVFVGGNIGNNGWVSVECAGTAVGESKIESEINQNFGIESVGHLRLFVDDGSNESMKISLSGIRYIAASSLLINTPVSFSTVTNYQILEQKSLNIKDDIRTYQ